MSRSTTRSTRRRRPIRWRRLVGWLLGLLLLGVIIGSALLIWAYRTTDIPDPNEFAEAQSSIIYYADGETELARFTGGTNRESVSLEDVPDHAEHAMLAAEDRSFYENEGVSVTGTVRALWRNLTSASTQGGSTITQQYVKNYYLTSEQTYTRKAREVLIAVKIDNELPKAQILENYLNTIYYGRGAYGIETAADAYFDTDAAGLSIAQGAFLAAVTNAPGLLDPAGGEENEARAMERVSYVLDGMVAEGWISQAQADQASFPQIQDPQSNTAVEGTDGYIAEAVRQELVAQVGVVASDVDRGGLRVTTTIEQQHQQAAEQAVADQLPTGANTEDLRVGLVAVRPGDGAVTALYGGADYADQQLSTATDARAQAGSLFKVFTLLGALREGVSTTSTYSGPSPMQFTVPGQVEPYEVNNFRDEQFGRIDLRTATAFSVNTVYVQLNEQIGGEHTRDAAIDAGLPEDTPGLDANLSNVLGTASPTVMEMAGAFATVAAQGERAEPYLVTDVSSTTGVYDYTAEPDPERAFDADVTADVTEAMTKVVTEGSGTGAGDLGRPAAGKSGTSENNRSAWFDGFVPQLSAAVLMYQGDGTVAMQDVAGLDQVTGGTFPAQIWGDFMRGAMEGTDVEQFPPRAGLHDGEVPPTRTPSPAPGTPSSGIQTPAPATSEPATTNDSPTTEDPAATSTSEPPTTSEPEPTSQDPAPPTSEPPPPTSQDPAPPSRSDPPADDQPGDRSGRTGAPGSGG